MTSVLNFGSSSSSNSGIPSNSLFSNAKLPTTFIIQPPSTQIISNSLLTKRCKPAELGDLLMKKIKSQTLSSESNSNQQSPIMKENSEENDLNCLESTSMIEEIQSPSVKSFCEEQEALNVHRMLEGVLIPQRSISTPLIVNTFNLRHSKGDSADNHKRVQHALEVLQKKMLMDQQACLLKEILFKTQTVQEPLIIPPLISASDTASSPANYGMVKKISGFDDDQEIIYGPVEYPLLDMAPAGLPSSSVTFGKSTKRLLGSLAVTRAETQRSDSDDLSSCTSEESAEALVVRRRQSKKASTAKAAEKGKKEKGQGKEKTKSKKQK